MVSAQKLILVQSSVRAWCWRCGAPRLYGHVLGLFLKCFTILWDHETGKWTSAFICCIRTCEEQYSFIYIYIYANWWCGDGMCIWWVYTVESVGYGWLVGGSVHNMRGVGDDVGFGGCPFVVWPSVVWMCGGAVVIHHKKISGCHQIKKKYISDSKKYSSIGIIILKFNHFSPYNIYNI